MKKTQILLSGIAVLLFSNTVFSQEKPKEWDVSLYGFARADYIFDTRQSAQVREYHLNLYPLDVKKDANGADINATGASNFLSVVSRVGVNFKGPDVWGAKASGKIEGDFFGNTQESIGLFRVRHAYAQLAWSKTSVTMGQTWYPSFVPEVFPGVANFSTGIMFNPFGWVGQLRVKQKFTDNLSLDVVAYKDREFTAITGTGATTNSATFNSSTPTLHAQLQFKNKNVVAGIGAEYQSLKPVIVSPTNLVSNEKLNSTMVMGYLKYSNEKIVAKAYGISGGNLSHMVMLGGFAEYNSTNGIASYKPTKTSAVWVDLASNAPKIAPGVFFGYTKNSGVDSNYNKLYARGVSGARVVDNVWRASARVDFKQNKFKISPELEYTAATWGDLQNDGTAGANQVNVGNFRAMVSAMYSF